MTATTTDQDVAAALDVARELARIGVPIFLARPVRDSDGNWLPDKGTAGYWLPQGWHRTAADPAVLDDHQPGDAVCAVMGHGLDLLDDDPRNGGDESLAGLKAAGAIPTLYAVAATPSDGWHGFLASLGVGSRDNIAPGIDFKGGTPQGYGRGFAFIAPTVKLSKSTGELAAYRWITPPDIERWQAEHADDDSGEALAEIIHAARSQNTPPESQNGASHALDTVTASPWVDVDKTLSEETRHNAIVKLASALRGRGGWRADDALEYMRAVIYPKLDQARGDHPYTLAELEKDVRDVFARYPDGHDDGGGDAPPDPGAAESVHPRLIDGGVFIFDAPDHVPAIWGTGQDVLWARGESCILAGPPGVGKTTLTGQLVRALVGLDRQVLGYDVGPAADRRVLYLAMDRPQQIARALRRHFTDDERATVSDRLTVWKGPPPADLAKHPPLLLELAQAAGADVVILDSLKDAAIGITDDETGAGYNRARQLALADGVEVLELHHVVKRGAGGGRPDTLADLYGSVWITAGAGSVVLLWGAAGDPIVELSHLKQPAAAVGPFRVIHDHENGVSTVWHSTDPLRVLELAGEAGVTAPRLAMAMFETEKPDRNQIEKARRKLAKLERDGLAESFEGPQQPGGGRAPLMFRPTTEPTTGVFGAEATTQDMTNHVPSEYAGHTTTEATTPTTQGATTFPPVPLRDGGTGAVDRTDETDTGKPSSAGPSEQGDSPDKPPATSGYTPPPSDQCMMRDCTSPRAGALVCAAHMPDERNGFPA